MTSASYYDSDEYKLKARILDRLHERVGRCGHCGKRVCAHRVSHSVLPKTVSADDLMAAIALDTPEAS